MPPSRRGVAAVGAAAVANPSTSSAAQPLASPPLVRSSKRATPKKAPLKPPVAVDKKMDMKSVQSPTQTILSDVRSPSSLSDDSNCDRKKATHLRCERQRREAINNGYNELKELLPSTMATAGCKTTNAAILFRAYDYMTQLNEECEKADAEVAQLESQVSALRHIIKHYEEVTAGSAVVANAPPAARMLQVLLDDCFKTFMEDMDFTNYETITRTLLTWIETLENDIQSTSDKMAAVPFKKARR